MPWFAIESLNSSGDPITREILHRDSKDKVVDFLLGRFKRRDGVLPSVWGWLITDIVIGEDYDADIEEKHTPSLHAIRVPLLDAEERAELLQISVYGGGVPPTQ